MEEKPKRVRWAVVAPALFFAAHYLYLWLRIDPRLLYEGSMSFPPFRTGAAFARQALARPGGVSEYLAAAGAQSYYWGWAGALCITAVSVALFLLARGWVCAAGSPRSTRAAYVPPLLVAAAYGAFGQPLVMLCSLALALALALLYARLASPSATRSPKSDIRDALLFLLLGLAAYAAAGGAMILYAILASLMAARAGGSRIRALLCFALAVAIPYAAGVLWLDLSTEQAYWRISALDLSLDGRGRGPLVLLTLYYPALLAWLLHSRSDGVAAPQSPLSAGEERSGHPAPVRPALLWALVAVAMVALAHFSFDHRAWQTRRIHYLTVQHQWDRLLDEASRIPARGYSFDLIHNVCRALYHSGRLLTDLFAYPMREDALLICMPESTGTPEAISQIREARYLEIGEQALEFGLLNGAAEEGHEALAIWGDHATTLRRLALTHLAKGQPEAARVFLNVLRRDLVQGKWAAETLARLDSDPLLDGDPEIRDARSLMLKHDPAFFYSTPEAMCVLLRQQNPLNRMAYEYQIAYYLTQRNIEAVVKALGDMEQFGYAQMPRLCQEAVVLLQVRSGKRPYAGSYRIDPDTFRRFEEFSSRMVPMQRAGQIEEAKDALAADFGDTLFYYYVFGASGVARR